MNGVLCTAADLQEWVAPLLQFHGQSEQVLLKDLRSHEKLLDAYGENAVLLEDYRAALQRVRKAEEKIKNLEAERQKGEEQRDFLEFQLLELEKAQLLPEEEAELEAKVQAGSQAGALEQARRDCATWISEGQTSLYSLMRSLRKRLETLSKDFPSIDPSIGDCDSVVSHLESIERALDRLGAVADVSPQELDLMNARLSTIQKLKRKYRTDFEGLLTLREQRRQEMHLLQDFASVLAEAELELKEYQAHLWKTALQISHSRQHAAKQLGAQVDHFLRRLGMPCDFAVEVLSGTSVADCGPSGADKVEFFVTPNKGEGRRPLRSSLSGGELSRIMLALKSALAGRDDVPTLIFDEVDTGISGETSHAVADALAGLAEYHQVLNITHLHQVACRSDAQVLVSKHLEDERTLTRVQVLDLEGRVVELARMMGGTHNELVLQHARELLAKVKV